MRKARFVKSRNTNTTGGGTAVPGKISARRAAHTSKASNGSDIPEPMGSEKSEIVRYEGSAPVIYRDSFRTRSRINNGF